MKQIKSVKVNGREASLIKMGGGIMYCNSNTYAVLAYLGSNGKQYIMTDLALNKKSSASVVYDIKSIGYKGAADYIGADAFLQIKMEPSGIRISTTNSTIPFTDGIVEESCSAGIVTLTANGTTITKDFTSISTTCNFALFGLNLNNYYYYAIMELRSAKVYSNGEMCYDFVPVRRIEDGELGMYDKVTKQFFTNQGTGSFTAGPATGQRY